MPPKAQPRQRRIASQVINETKRYPAILQREGSIRLAIEDTAKLKGNLFMHRMNVNLHCDILDTPDYFWEHSVCPGPWASPCGPCPVPSADPPRRFASACANRAQRGTSSALLSCGRTVRCARGVRYVRPVFLNGQGDGGTYRVPIHGTSAKCPQIWGAFWQCKVPACPYSGGFSAVQSVPMSIFRGRFSSLKGPHAHI